jgi:hypothetical protein
MQPQLKFRTKFDYASYESAHKNIAFDALNLIEPTEADNNMVSNTFAVIWGEYYNQRNGVTMKNIRTFPLSKILAYIEDIYTCRWKFDEEQRKIAIEDPLKLPNEKTLSDTMYDLFLEWYKLTDVSIRAIHSFFCSVEGIERMNQVKHDLIPAGSNI